MRIAIINNSRNVIGGAETYIRHILPSLVKRGHDVAFWHEMSLVGGHEIISLPEGTPSWCVADLGSERALNELRQWRPDVIYSHGLDSPALEAATQKIAHSIFFAHAYYGSCVSGSKAFSFPIARPCDRTFGWQCLLHYYPRRCGGLSPLTMLSDYALQRKRRSMLHDYGVILVASTHMAREYAKYGLKDRVTVVRLPVSVEYVPQLPEKGAPERQNWHILVLGRMESLKGGAVFLESLPTVVRESELPVRVTFAGEGRFRKEWEQRAAQLAGGNPRLEFHFTGWIKDKKRSEVLLDSDLLVMPSLWPEPFGLTGMEAGLFGIPVVAFAVGGIPDWLKHGVNGLLAPGDPPTSGGLATAILDCICDEVLYGKLRHGARENAQLINLEDHLSMLLEIFQRSCLRG